MYPMDIPIARAIHPRNIRWKAGDPARLTFRVVFFASPDERPTSPCKFPIGTLVRVTDVRHTRRGNYGTERIRVERTDPGAPTCWAWLDPDCIERPENFDA